MTNLGVYYAPEHRIPEDADYIRKLQPPVIRLLDPDVQQIADMHALVPGAIICPRTWAIDDGSDKEHPSRQVNRIMADPIGTGIDHANQYSAQLGQWREQAHQRGLTLPPDDHIYFNSANEPNQGGSPDKIAAYAVAFLNRCTELNIRATALCLGVGWPDNTGPDTPVNWQPYIDAGLEQALRRGSHWLELHEYFYKTGPQDGWRWLAGRHLQCPLTVPILLAEIGMDSLVYDKRWAKDGGNRGWQGNVSPEQYAEMIKWQIRNSDTRVVAALVFVTDFRNREWESFNTRGAHSALLARKDEMIPTIVTTGINFGPSTSQLSAGTKTAYVAVPSGANLRSEPRTGDTLILLAVPYGDPVTVLGTNADATWSNATYNGVTGWILAALLTFNKPAGVTPIPPSQPSAPVGDKFQRCLAFVRKWEGGFVNDPNDSGGATNKGVTIATFTNWRKAQGKPAPTVADLRALSDAEADQIYHDLYWVPSGADQLPYPLCLSHFDTAVNAGVDTATEMLNRSGGAFDAYMGNLIQWYASLPDFVHFGVGWMRRRGDLLIEASK